jgi:hypothetical protein
MFCNIGFHSEELLAPRPTPKMEDHPLLAVDDCLFNIFAATLHIGGRSSIRTLRTRRAVVIGTHLELKNDLQQLLKFYYFITVEQCYVRLLACMYVN